MSAASQDRSHDGSHDRSHDGSHDRSQDGSHDGSYDGSQASRHALAHDLRGPVLTIDGFVAELRSAAEELERAASRADTDAAALRARVLDIARVDLLPCLECIAAAAATLGARVDALDGAGDASTGAEARARVS